MFSQINSEIHKMTKVMSNKINQYIGESNVQFNLRLLVQWVEFVLILYSWTDTVMNAETCYMYISSVQ